MGRKKQNQEIIHRTFRMKKEDNDKLETLAIHEGMSVSHLIRKYLELGMTIDGHKANIDFIRQQIREEIRM